MRGTGAGPPLGSKAFRAWVFGEAGLTNPGGGGMMREIFPRPWRGDDFKTTWVCEPTHGDEHGQEKICLFLWFREREHRRRCHDEGDPRRQGRQPRRNGERGPAGAGGLHGLDRSVRLLRLAQRQISRGDVGAAQDPAQEARNQDEEEAGRSQEPPAGVGAFGRRDFHAGHDGYRSQSRPERQVGAGLHREHRQRAHRLGLLPPLHRHVRRRGHGTDDRPDAPRLRSRNDRIEEEVRRAGRHRPDGRTAPGTVRDL